MHDQPRTGVGLPRAGRSLDHEVTAAQVGDELLRRFEVVLRERRGEGLADEDRLGRGVALVVGDHRAGQTPQGLLLHLRVVRPARNQGLRQRNLVEGRAAPQRERSGFLVERLDVPRGTPGRRVVDVVSLGEVVHLRRERERPDERLPRAHRGPRRLEPADRFGVALLELLARPPDPVEERPPDGLRLAPVVEEELREQPARPVGFADVVGILGQAGEQSRAQLLGLDCAGGRLARLLRLRLRRVPGPLGQQPVAELHRRDAVLLVVGGDVVEDLRVAAHEPVLVHHDRVVARLQVGVPLEVERLDVLEPVVLVRDAQPLRDDLVEVDEDLAAEQVVELLLARPVLAREPLQLGDLVGGVVVDVHRGVGGAALAEQVDHSLDGPPLLRAVVRPERAERAGGVDDSPEVLEPAAGLPERVALDVEEEVAVARRRQQHEAARRLGREHLPRVPVRACGDLHRRLVAQRLERARRHRRRPRVVRRERELRDGGDALARRAAGPGRAPSARRG